MRDALLRRVLVPAVAGLAACLCAPAASTAIVRQPCSAPGKLVAATASAALSITPDRTFYGCVRGHRARRLVNDDISGSAKGGVATGAPRLVNNRAGWVFEYCDRGGCEVRLEIRNLSTGQRTSARLTGFPETTAVRALLSEKGVLVLSRRTPTGGEIVKLKRGGGEVTLSWRRSRSTRRRARSRRRKRKPRRRRAACQRAAVVAGAARRAFAGATRQERGLEVEHRAQQRVVVGGRRRGQGSPSRIARGKPSSPRCKCSPRPSSSPPVRAGRRRRGHAARGGARPSIAAANAAGVRIPSAECGRRVL